MLIINKFYKSDFIKNIAILMTGTTIVQAIPVLVSPVLTRLYSPADFGIFATYTAIISIIGNLSSGRYELGIVLPKFENRAFHLRRLCSLLGFFLSIVILLFILTNKNYVASFIGTSNYVILIVIPVGIFFVNEIKIFTFYIIRNNSFRQLSIARISHSTTASSYQVLSGFYFNTGAIGLIIGQLLGQLASLIILMKNRISVRIRRKYNLSVMIAVAKRYSDFPKKMLPAGLVDILTPYIPIFVFGQVYSPAIVGFFSLSQRVVQTPMSIIGSSVGDVFFKKATELSRINPEKLKTLSIKISISLFIIGLFPMLILLFFASDLFKFIFGKDWITTGKFVQIMSGYLCFQFALSPLSRLYAVLERQSVFLIWEWTRFILILLGTLVGSIYFKPAFAMIFYTISMIISYLILALITYNILDAFIKKTNLGNN